MKQQLESESRDRDYAMTIKPKPEVIVEFSIREFSILRTTTSILRSMYAGCGETPYVKLVTQLFGDRDDDMLRMLQVIPHQFRELLHHQCHTALIKEVKKDHHGQIHYLKTAQNMAMVWK